MTNDRSDTKERQITVRLPVSLLSALEDHRSRMRDASRGVNVTLSDTVRSLLLASLDGGAR